MNIDIKKLDFESKLGDVKKVIDPIINTKNKI